MRDFNTLFDGKVIGVEPETKAVNASTETSFDGSPWLKRVIDDLIIVPIQAILNFVGQTTNGQPEEYNDSQLFDAMREAFSTAEKQTISASGPVVFGPTNHEVEVDLSGGNLSITQLPVPDFIGQKVHIYGVGSWIGDIAGGTGLYVNGVFFTENTGGVFLTAISLTEWRAENGVTADYVLSGFKVLRYSNGDIRQLAKVIKNNGLTTAQTITYAVPLVGVVRTVLERVDSETATIAIVANTPTITQIPISILNHAGVAVTTVVVIDLQIEGEY